MATILLGNINVSSKLEPGHTVDRPPMQSQKVNSITVRSLTMEDIIKLLDNMGT